MTFSTTAPACKSLNTSPAAARSLRSFRASTKCGSTFEPDRLPFAGGMCSSHLTKYVHLANLNDVRDISLFFSAEGGLPSSLGSPA